MAKVKPSLDTLGLPSARAGRTAAVPVRVGGHAAPGDAAPPAGPDPARARHAPQSELGDAISIRTFGCTDDALASRLGGRVGEHLGVLLRHEGRRRPARNRRLRRPVDLSGLRAHRASRRWPAGRPRCCQRSAGPVSTPAAATTRSWPTPPTNRPSWRPSPPSSATATASPPCSGPRWKPPASLSGRGGRVRVRLPRRRARPPVRLAAPRCPAGRRAPSSACAAGA